MIIQSPHIHNPTAVLSDAERRRRYHQRIGRDFEPYTVFDTLRRVYHVNFRRDLETYLDTCPQPFLQDPGNWKGIHFWLNGMRFRGTESVFYQPQDHFLVDMLFAVRIRIEERRRGDPDTRKYEDWNGCLGLRYVLNLCPCCLWCRFERVVFDSEGLIRQNPDNIPLDRYLIPILREGDYERIAGDLLTRFFPASRFSCIPVKPISWVRQKNFSLRYGEFEDNTTLGEYFFDFGEANILDPESGTVRPHAEVNPGTIVLNSAVLLDRITENVTIMHEMTHSYTGAWFFFLQRMRGAAYTSFLCKKNGGAAAVSPVETLEYQANILPRYMMIPSVPGRQFVEERLKACGGKRSVSNMCRLIDEVASFYGTSKTMARSRLVDFGYTEARGFLRFENGERIPAYLSALSRGRTYLIDTSSALKEYVRNPRFRILLDSRLYISAEGHYCLNSGRFLWRDRNGVAHLNAFARTHMEQCCLVFREHAWSYYSRFSGRFLARNRGNGASGSRSWDEDGFALDKTEAERIRREIAEELNSVKKYTPQFRNLTVELMQERKLSIQDLVNLTGISRDTIKNMRNQEGMVFRVREVAAIAIAMHLPPALSDMYIEVSPCKFLQTEEMFAYRFAVRSWYMLSVAEVNQRLIELGYRPLTEQLPVSFCSEDTG